MKKTNKQQRTFKRIIKKISKGYFTDFDEGKTYNVQQDDLNDHTNNNEKSDHTNPNGKKNK
jgi:hypothetical protein